MTEDLAQKLVRVARQAARRIRHRSTQGIHTRSKDALRRWVAEIRQSKADGKRKYQGVPASEQGLRLLRHAFEVFEAKPLKRLLMLLGPTKTFLLAKLPAADRRRVVSRPRIVPWGRAQTDVDLVAVSVRELEVVVRRRRQARGDRSNVPTLPAALFKVPEDLDAMYDFLIRRLKSLKAGAKSIARQFRWGVPDDDQAKLLRRLEGLLTFSLRLVSSLLHDPATKDIDVAGSADDNGPVRARVVRGELRRMLDAVRAAARSS